MKRPIDINNNLDKDKYKKIKISDSESIELLKLHNQLLSTQNTISQIEKQANQEIAKQSQSLQQLQQVYSKKIQELAGKYNCPNNAQFDANELNFLIPTPTAAAVDPTSGVETQSATAGS